MSMFSCNTNNHKATFLVVRRVPRLDTRTIRVLKMLILLTLVSASAGKMDPFIVGGAKASIVDWPFITFIEAAQFGAMTSACGGSLLSSQTVLTAAHCLDDVTKKRALMFATTFTIYMGHSRYDEATMSRKVLDYETHSDYDPDDGSVKCDIGIMFLVGPVAFSHLVQKAVLQKRRFNAKRDKYLAVAGWGAVDPEAGGISSRLKSVYLRPEIYEKCQEMFKVICTEMNDDEYAYSGDSGGPMVNSKTHRQLGIVSFRDEGTGMTVFTSIPDYWNWIKWTQMNLYQKYCGK